MVTILVHACERAPRVGSTSLSLRSCDRAHKHEQLAEVPASVVFLFMVQAIPAIQRTQTTSRRVVVHVSEVTREPIFDGYCGTVCTIGP